MSTENVFKDYLPVIILIESEYVFRLSVALAVMPFFLVSLAHVVKVAFSEVPCCRMTNSIWCKVLRASTDCKYSSERTKLGA